MSDETKGSKLMFARLVFLSDTHEWMAAQGRAAVAFAGGAENSGELSTKAREALAKVRVSTQALQAAMKEAAE